MCGFPPHADTLATWSLCTEHLLSSQQLPKGLQGPTLGFPPSGFLASTSCQAPSSPRARSLSSQQLSPAAVPKPGCQSEAAHPSLGRLGGAPSWVSRDPAITFAEGQR